MYNDVDNDLTTFIDSIDAEDFLFSNTIFQHAPHIIQVQTDLNHQQSTPQSNIVTQQMQNQANQHPQQQQQIHQQQQQIHQQQQQIHQQQQPTHLQFPNTQGGFQAQVIQQDQFQTKWIALVQSNDQYQTFNASRPQFMDKSPQHIIHNDFNTVTGSSQDTLNNILIAQNQPIIQSQPTQLNQPQRNQPHQQDTLQLHPSIQTQLTHPVSQPIVTSVQSFQQIQTELKPKVSVPPTSNTTISITTNNNNNNINNNTTHSISSINKDIQSNDQYQTFNASRPQFMDKLPQHIIHNDFNTVTGSSQDTINNILIAQNQPIIQSQPTQLNQPQRIQQHQQHTIQLHPSIQTQLIHPVSQPIVTSIQSFHQIQAELKPKVPVPPTSNTTISITTINNNNINNNTTHSISSTNKDDDNNNNSNNCYYNTQNNINDDNIDNINLKKETLVKQKPKEKQTRLDCPYCQRCFSKNFDLQQHMRCHTGEKPFQCIVCGRGFAQKSNVKKHMQAHKVWPEGPNPLPSNIASARSRNNYASSSMGTPRDDECMQENESLQANDNNNNINSSSNNNSGGSVPLGLSQDKKNEGNEIFAENRYSCSYCPFNGRTYFELKSHLTVHKREKVFKCIVSSCGKTFSGCDLQGFLDHVTDHKDLIYHCHLCSGQFYSLEDFGEHQKNHGSTQAKKNPQQQLALQNQNPQQPQQSSNVLINQPASNNSLKQQNRQTSAPANSNINSTLQPQKNTKQFNLGQKNQQQQTLHNPNITTNLNINNNNININISNNNNNISISDTSNNNNIDNNTISSSVNQKSSSLCPSTNKNETIEKVQKYFRCTKCMNRYTTQTALDHHLSISTHNYPCNECNKVFMCERYLRRHLNTHTTIQHVCTFCDKQFKTAAYLKMHSVVHTGEKPFRCNLCDAAFNRRDKLNRHKLTHETTKKFKCPYMMAKGCTKEFNRPDKLKAHVLTHSDTRPHSCDSCERTFSRLSRLKEHKKLRHGQIQMEVE